MLFDFRLLFFARNGLIHYSTCYNMKLHCLNNPRKKPEILKKKLVGSKSSSNGYHSLVSLRKLGHILPLYFALRSGSFIASSMQGSIGQGHQFFGSFFKRKVIGGFMSSPVCVLGKPSLFLWTLKAVMKIGLLEIECIRLTFTNQTVT